METRVGIWGEATGETRNAKGGPRRVARENTQEKSGREFNRDARCLKISKKIEGPFRLRVSTDRLREGVCAAATKTTNKEKKVEKTKFGHRNSNARTHTLNSPKRGSRESYRESRRRATQSASGIDGNGLEHASLTKSLDFHKRYIAEGRGGGRKEAMDHTS